MNTYYEQRAEQMFIGLMTNYPVAAHLHTLAEVFIVTSGFAVVTIDDVQYKLTPGDAAAVFPLVPHSFDRLSEDSKGVIAIFPPEVIPEFAGTFRSMQPTTPVITADKSNLDVRFAVERLSVLNMDDSVSLCVAYLHVILAGLLPALTYRPVYDYSERGLGRRIISYITEHAYEEITLENASHALGISPSHLSHFFSERLHTNFRRFINTIRIEKALMLMRNPNLTLTEVCGACGYINMRTFRRAFQQETGRLPSDHQAELRSRAVSDDSQFTIHRA